MHTQLGFALTLLDISVVSGMFDSFDGSLTVGESPETTALSMSADTATKRPGSSPSPS